MGTEERLTICKEQLNHGLDSNNTNYLSSFKFEAKLLKELSKNVKGIFDKCIILDTQTLGDRVVFRVGDNFEYIKGLFDNDQNDIIRLLNEKKLDDQGDGLKSYVSTFLSLNLKGSDVLLIDEPEAFLHPPLARQVGELIGDFGDEKQIFVSTHSVEVLKGILSKSSDVNVIRITASFTYRNYVWLTFEWKRCIISM
ncbi:MAG: AAA family ATPase [Erysipelotrichaceae bacterium]|nr:AAA family ATPase [Erysipelotrichaceae bacterium]